MRTRMNHLPTSAFRVRESVKRDLVRLCWAPTDLLACDALTKNLGRAKLERFQRFMLGLPDSPAIRSLVTSLVTAGAAAAEGGAGHGLCHAHQGPCYYLE